MKYEDRLINVLKIMIFFSIFLAFAGQPSRATAEVIKIGTLKLAQYGPAFIAKEKGYFAAENLDADFIFFESGEPTAVAVASGDVDFAVMGTSGAVFNLGGQGVLRIIGGNHSEAPSFRSLGIVVANRAYAAGLTSYQGLAGHSVAVTQIGSPPHYGLAVIAEKYGLDFKSMRLLPLQSIPNEVTAVSGGQADVGLMPATAAIPAVQRGDMKLLGWMGDEAQWQLGVLLTSTKNATNRPEFVERYLRAYRKGTRAYHDAFTGPDGKRHDEASAPEILAVLAKVTGQTPEQLASGIVYADVDARLNVKDVLHQIDWFKSQGMVKAEVDGQAMIDKRYVVPLPGS
jgi:NitT/TauT family transport system substrate-binding protein